MDEGQWTRANLLVFHILSLVWSWGFLDRRDDERTLPLIVGVLIMGYVINASCIFASAATHAFIKTVTGASMSEKEEGERHALHGGYAASALIWVTHFVV